MSLASHYDKIASVERLSVILDEDDNPTNKKEFSSHLASVPCLIQQLSDEVAQDMTGAFGKDFLMLSPIVDIAEGDRVIIDSEEYRIMGTEALNFGNNPHRETRLRIFKSS